MLHATACSRIAPQVTLMGPNNAAVDAFVESQGGLDNIDQATLAKILTYHGESFILLTLTLRV